MPRSRRSIAVLSLTLAAGLPAAAQCTWDVHYVPDFDQKREVATGIPGLPGSGGMYCMPTSTLNWFAYFANRGITQPAGLNGPRNWQANSNYNLVTNNLALMGSLMGTTTADGTNGNGALSGAALYSLGLAQNKIGVNHYWAGNGDPISPAQMRLMHALGGFMVICYGRYTLDSGGHYTRDGGHCLTLVGQIDSCAPITSTVRFRDPASDGYNSTQSQFVTHDVPVTATTAFFRGSASSSYDEDTRWRMTWGSGIKFLDSILYLYPRVALCPTVLFPTQLHIHRPFVFEGATQPPTQTINLPAGVGAIRGLVMHPTRMSYFAITAPVGGQSHLYEINPETLVVTDVMVGGDFRYMDVNRFGEIYLCDGSVLKAINPRTSPPTLINLVALSSVPRMMAYDDATDTLAFLTPAGATASQFARYNRGLSALGAVAPLPGGVNPTGNQFLAFSRTGNIFMCGDGSVSIFRMTQSGNILTMLPTVNAPAGDQPSGLSIDDNDHILFAGGGVIREFELDVNNRYVLSPSPAFAGFPAGGRLCIPRSRTNHIPALHEGPGFANIPNPEVAPGVADCYANCDFSTTPPTLNVLDFACFLNQFAAGKIEANCDGSTTPPVLNVLDFACFLNAFAGGCP